MSDDTKPNLSETPNSSRIEELAAENARLLEIIKVQRDALNRIEDVNSAIEYPYRNTSHSDWELRRMAREAIATVNEIAKQIEVGK